MAAKAAIGADGLLPVAALAIVAAAVALGLKSSLGLLHSNWTGWYGPNEHGYLVLAASLWIAIVAWRTNPPRSLRPDWWALVPLAVLIALVAGLELMFVNNSRLLLLPPLVLVAAALVFGREAAKRLFWPALFLYFALPQWWVINGPLQALTTTAVTYGVRWTGVPAFVDGNFIHLPSGTFEIASGCSGLNYLQAATALAAFHGLLSLSTWRNRLVLLAAAAGVAVVFNWIRVYAVIVVGHLSDMRHYLITVEHHTFGWVLFMIAMVPLFIFASRLERRETRRADDASPGPSAGAIPRVSPLVVPAALAAAGLLLLPVITAPETANDSTLSTELPAALDGETRAPITSGWSPVFANASEDSASFIAASASPAVDVYRAVYPHQDSERRLLRPSNDFLGAEFRLLEQQRRSVTLGDGEVLGVTEYRGTLNQRARVIWAWYWVGDTRVAGTFEAKLAEARGLLTGRRDGTAIAVAADCIPGCAAAEKRLSAFVSRHEQQLRWPGAARP